MIFGGNNVDFIEIGFMISSDNGVAVCSEIISDGRFGLLSDFGSVFLRIFRCFEIRNGFAWFKGFAMFRCETVFINGGDVNFGAIADVFFKTIVRIFSGEIFHILITSNFGYNRGGGNFADESVGFDTGSDVGF